MKGTKYIALLFPLFLTLATFSQSIKKSSIRYLALGDSYTIGEGVQEAERWPNQLAEALRNSGVTTSELTNIARTGWTTSNLLSYVGQNNPDNNYDLVSLLIGVNNQFQGRNIDTYRDEFRKLLELAVRKCGNRKEGVFVLSIPDYGYTPFGSSDKERISEEIDQYNAINEQITRGMGIAYYDITPISRQALQRPSYLAPDNLHPSGEMYARWVALILQGLRVEIVTSATAPDATGEVVVVYPNPVQNTLYFKLPEDAGNMAIYDSRGVRQGMWENKGGQTQSIDISSWSSGVYFYTISNVSGTLVQGKLVKR